MTWGQGSTIPKRIKDQVRRRDKTCRLAHPGCTHHIEEFHHPQGLADQGMQRMPVRSAAEVVGVCSWCHAIDTRQRQAHGRQRARTQRGNLSRRYRDHEDHPGHITAGQEGRG